VLYVNEKGNFFSDKNLAQNSVEKADELKQISRDEALGKKSGAGNKDKLIITTADEIKLCFDALNTGDIPKIGDKAKVGRNNAKGVYKVNPQLSYEFENGELTKIIEPKE
jgi:hypothetical protein